MQSLIVDFEKEMCAKQQFIRCPYAGRVCRELACRGIAVRDRSAEPKLENCLRVTVGTPRENDILLTTINEITI